MVCRGVWTFGAVVYGPMPYSYIFVCVCVCAGDGECDGSRRTVWWPVTPGLWIPNLCKCHFEAVDGWIRASFTLFFLLFIFFPHASPIQEIDRKVSRDVSTFYSSLFLFPRKVKVLLFPLFQILFSYRLHILMITYNYRWLKKFRLFSTYINRRKP